MGKLPLCAWSGHREAAALLFVGLHQRTDQGIGKQCQVRPPAKAANELVIDQWVWRPGSFRKLHDIIDGRVGDVADIEAHGKPGTARHRRPLFQKEMANVM